MRAPVCQTQLRRYSIYLIVKTSIPLRYPARDGCAKVHKAHVTRAIARLLANGAIHAAETPLAMQTSNNQTSADENAIAQQEPVVNLTSLTAARVNLSQTRIHTAWGSCTRQ